MNTPEPGGGAPVEQVREELERSREENRRLVEQRHAPVAVVGIGLRVPGGSRTVEDFAGFLREGRSGIGPVPADRWDVEAFAARDPQERGRIQTDGGGFLDRIDLFDARFFNISPKEAHFVDPQQRMLLETAWEALEHANLDPAPTRGGKGGVYVGGSSIDYAIEATDLDAEELDAHLAAGTTIFPLAGRISYVLGWRGPSMSVDTACASSLTAIHLAVGGLRNGECDLALAGGVNALHHPRIWVTFSHANMLAPDGRCKTFDEAADGYARAEGCGMLVLKRLADAQRDGDRIWAVISGTAVGQDGDSAGLTVPNGVAQEATIRAALADARLEPADIQYVEAHGTGTPLGDPIELGAINDVFASSHDRRDPLVVGSVKTNLGHMEPAAGVIAVIKTVLQLQERTIFPHLNLEQPSGRIPWDAYPIEIPRTGRPWDAERRRAVVNSFGFTGTIAAAVVEEPPAAPDAAPGGELPEPVFTLSAKDGRSLIRQAERYREFLDAHPGLDIRDVCYTANVGRSHFPARLAAPVADAAALRTLLDKQIAAGAKQGRRAERAERPVRKTAFLFAGQGSQYPGMGAALHRRHEVFRAAVDRCDDLFAPLMGESVKALLLDPAADPDRLAETRFTQPSLFALEYALARLWISWGVRPNVMIGHSIGEVVAAAVAGVFDLEDAVRLVAARARLMQAVTAPGGMLAVTAGVAEIEPLLADYPDLALAAVNAPTQCVVSGGTDSLRRLGERLEGLGVRTKPLAVSHAFHSPLMAEVYDRFREAVADIEFHAPSITLISNVTGKVAEAARLRTPEYWVAHIGAPVLFEAGMSAVGRRGRHAMLEIGPSSALTSLARQCVPVDEHRWVTSLSRTDRDGTAVLRALAQLYTAGLPVAWHGVHAGREGRKITLPAYNFEQRRYWLPNQGRRHGLGGASGHPLLGREVTSQTQRAAGEREFAASVDGAHPAYLADHVLLGRCVMPAGGYLEALFAVQDAVFGETRRPVLGLQVREPLVFEEDRTVELRTRLRPAKDGRTEVEFVSVLSADEQDAAAQDAAAAQNPRSQGSEPGDPERERLHATATLGPAEPDDAARVQTVRPRGAGEAVAERTGSDVYGALTDLGLDYGPRFRLLTHAARNQDAAGGAGRVTAGLETRPATAAEYFPPEFFESAAHAATAWAEGSIALLPIGFERAVLHRKPRSQRLTVTVGGIERVADDLVADLTVADEDGQPVLELAGLRFTDASSVISGVQRPWYHEQRWVSRPAGAPVPRDRHVLLLGRDESWFAPIRVRAEAAGVVLSVARDLDEAAAILTGPQPVTDLWWHWRGSGGRLGVPAFREDAERNYRELLELAALLDKEGFGLDQRLWLLTERGQFVPGDPADRFGDAMAASLWGFGHVLLNEHPAFRTTMVDLPDPQADPLLLDELLAPDADEFQVCFRAGRRKVRRMFPCAPTVPWEPGFELRVRTPQPQQDPANEAGPAGLEAVPAEDRAPDEGEIQLIVHAAVLTAQDLGADPAAPLGPRAAGTVVAAGPGTDFRVGDEVLVEAPGCLRRRITVPQAAAARKPLGTGFVPAVAANENTETFTLDELDEAARAAARDGAAVLDLLAHRPRAAREVRLRPDRGYLVTGGLGGLGLVAARKLAAQGARHLLLVGRRTPSPQEQAEFDAGFDGLAEVRYLQGDIADPADVERVFAELAASGRPVGGIVHTAGVLADGPVSAQTWETIDKVFGAKVYGTWLLHEAAQQLPDLDFFVGYSSAAAGLGGVTQSNYAAANAFMDNVMRWRALRGLPGLSINWGPWSQVGMSSRLTPQIMRAWEDQGISFFTPERGTSALVSLLGAPLAQVGFGQCDWPRFVSHKPVANALYEPVLGAAEDAGDGFDLDAVLRLEGAQRGEALEALVLAELGRVLRVADPDELDPDTEFLNLGLDSLMAMELRAALQGALRTPLPASVAFDHPTTVALADFLAAQLTARPAAAPRTEHS